VKTGLLVAVSGAAVLIAGLAGCSSDDKSASESATSEATSPATTTSAVVESPTATAAPGGTRVTIDGQDQQITGTVMCNAMGGTTNIAIGEGTTGITAVVGEGDAPNVTAVGLGNVNGVTLAVGGGAGEATAQKDGNTYKISGNATGIDMANPTSPVTKPFEIEVTCP
jgi:lipoprotein LpqH